MEILFQKSFNVKGVRNMDSLTPKQIVSELDKYIIGQTDAKKMVAVALRNRYRRRLVSDDIKEDIIPKNILMIGPTGVGKTEIARRLAKMVKAPFVKVEATKFTEVGYVGRDVESIIRDLVEDSVRIVKEERINEISEKSKEMAKERIIEILAPSVKKKSAAKSPFDYILGFQADKDQADNSLETEKLDDELALKRQQIKKQLEDGLLDSVMVEIEVEENSSNPLEIIAGGNIDESSFNMQDVLGSIFPKKKKNKKVAVKDALKILEQEEGSKLIDMEDVHTEARRRAEEDGIIFVDEMDKIAGKGSSHGPDISREGVQRDILPIVEGSTVTTKYGPVKTDYMLFIAAGAFHVSKVSDLIPELQGRFPVRVELKSLTKEDFKKILLIPKNALIKQYTALLATENIEIDVREDAVDAIADIAFKMNLQFENIGARRLHTVLEEVFVDVSFEAPDIEDKQIVVDKDYVNDKIKQYFKVIDENKYII
jgi:ATP-dependent HslUV protease ATP-binding subunit HslU